ncbi:MAG: intradiol ring-cleavage dioxygenase [Thermoleophilia bacterium]|nr:intradiol ring-cleavage dioxygenase [Thermoleophilia bacterium]
MRRAAPLWLLAAAAVGVGAPAESAGACKSTRPDALGPFYEPGAPVRSKVGTGYVLSGRVLAAGSCRALARARIEFWLVNPRGVYDDAHRATVFTRKDGRYRFESNRPVAYGTRPPHIHVRVTARGFRTLVTQHYPRAGRSQAVFNLVLRRA